MNRENLFDGISEIRDDLIEEAGRNEFQKREPIWKRVAAVAAALILVIGAGTAGFFIAFGRKGSSAGPGSDGHTPEDPISYMYYTGPVFPLASLSGSGGITAQRGIHFDFDHSADGAWARVTDSYVLSNETGADITLRLSYPFAAALFQEATLMPVVTVDGEAVETQLHVGPYSDGTANLDYIDSWEGYGQLLEDGSYREAAYGEPHTLDIPVTVYRVDNYRILETETKASNPTLNFEFQAGEGTTIFTYNSNGGRNDLENGIYQRHTSGLDNTYRPPEPMYVILVGDDLLSYRLQGYQDGGCSKGEELEIIADVTRYETTLEEFLRSQVSFTPAPDGEDLTISDFLTEDQFFGCITEQFCSYGSLGDTPMDRYGSMLEDYISGASNMSRVLYLSFTVTVPAGESLEISASMEKEGSYDFYGNSQRGTGCKGYDLVTKLGSDLTFTEQTASLSGSGITILGQNFGFDPENGVTRVTLDPEQAHYWIEICK